MNHEIECDDGLRCDMHAEDDLARLTAAVDVPAGSTLCVTKYLGYGWSARRSTPALRAQVHAALSGAMQTGWAGLLAEQRRFLDDFWATADVEIEGDDELQQAVRFALFHVLQAGARGESRAIPAKGLTGPGYDGHSFWDTETFVLPVLTYTSPESARDALRWRHSTVDKAKDRADALGLDRRGVPLAVHRRRRVLGVLAGRHRRVPRLRRRRRRDGPLPRGDRGHRLRARPRGRAARGDRPAVGPRSATTTCTAASASTASPGRTSTPRWWTTTSTRT